MQARPCAWQSSTTTSQACESMFACLTAKYGSERMHSARDCTANASHSTGATQHGTYLSMHSPICTLCAPKQPIKTIMQASFPPILPLRTPAQVARQAAYDAHVSDADVEDAAWARCSSRKAFVQFFQQRDAVLRERGIRRSKKLHPGVLQRLEQQQQGPPLGPILVQTPWPRDLEPDRAVMTVIAAVARMYGVFYIICTPQQAQGFIRDAHQVAASAGNASERLTAWLPPAEAAAVAEEQQQEDEDFASSSSAMSRRKSSQQQAEDRAARMEKRRRLSEQQQEQEQQGQGQGQGGHRRQRQLRPACVMFHGTLASAALAFFQQLLAHAADHIADLDQYSRGMYAESLKWHVPRLSPQKPPPFQVLTVPIVHNRSIATHMLQSKEDRPHADINARFRNHVTQAAAAAIRPGRSLAQQMDLTEYGEGDCWDQVEEQQRQQDASYQAGQQAVRSVGQAQWAWLQQQGEEEQDEEEEQGDVQIDEEASMQELLQLQQQTHEHMAAFAAAVQPRAVPAQAAATAAGQEDDGDAVDLTGGDDE